MVALPVQRLMTRDVILTVFFRLFPVMILIMIILRVVPRRFVLRGKFRLPVFLLVLFIKIILIKRVFRFILIIGLFSLIVLPVVLLTVLTFAAPLLVSGRPFLIFVRVTKFRRRLFLLNVRRQRRGVVKRVIGLLGGQRQKLRRVSVKFRERRMNWGRLTQ